MFLHKYYLEIKNRLFLLLLSWSFTLTACSAHKEVLLFLITKSTSSITTSFSENNVQLYFIFTDVKELFYVYFKLIFFVTNQLCVTLLFYQMFMFFYLGFYVEEYKKTKKVLKCSLVFFVVAIFVSYIFIIPLSWNFFLSFQYKMGGNIQLSSLFFEAKISEFFDFVIQTHNICLLSFQFVGLTLLMVNSLFLKTKCQKLKVFRKAAYFSFFLFSTIVTPPDVISQIVMSFFLILIYEIFIFMKIFHLSPR